MALITANTLVTSANKYKYVQSVLATRFSLVMILSYEWRFITPTTVS
jgi:hypothetical protein